MDAGDRDLGLNREITRRDFLSGVSIAVTGAVIAPALLDAEAQASAGRAADPAAPDYYPPTRTGLRGSHPGSFEVAHQLRDRKSWAEAGTDTGESYDLIVVGGGLSGLAAAHYFRAAVGPRAKILVLDNHDDFGGHAKRNEFQHGDRTLILNGGTLNIEAPLQYSAVSMALLRTIGIDIDRFEKETAEGRNLYRSLNLGNSVFFNKEQFGVDRLVVGPGRPSWAEFVAKTPLPAPAQKDIVRLESKDQPDYMPGLSSDQKKRRLIRMSYQDFLLNVARVHPDAAWYYQARSDGLFMAHIDALPAYYAWNMNFPGFQGMGLDPTPPEVLVYEPGGLHGRESQERANLGGRAVHFPDGNATVARLIVRSLIPEAVPGKTQEDVVTARVNYALLDRDGAPARIRLNSTAVHVRHDGEPGSASQVIVTYVRGAKAQTVRASHCVLACWNYVIPYMCPELPDKQKEALAYGIKPPIVYTNVLLRNWTAFQKLGISSVSAPGSYHTSFGLSEAVSIGDYQHARTPEDPIVIDLHKSPCAPGKTRKEQIRLGQRELLTTTFETFERNIRDQLGRTLSGGGFDPARDIEAITVNRWPHGYAYNYNTLADPVDWSLSSPEDRACVVGRRQFGRISIANSDAAGSSHSDAAIEQAFRAVGEVIESRTRSYLSRIEKS